MFRISLREREKLAIIIRVWTVPIDVLQII